MWTSEVQVVPQTGATSNHRLGRSGSPQFIVAYTSNRAISYTCHTNAVLVGAHWVHRMAFLMLGNATVSHTSRLVRCYCIVANVENQAAPLSQRLVSRSVIRCIVDGTGNRTNLMWFLVDADSLNIIGNHSLIGPEQLSNWMASECAGSIFTCGCRRPAEQPVAKSYASDHCWHRCPACLA